MTHVGIIGFGSQAKAFSQNLKDSGFNVTIFLRSNSSSLTLACKQGFSVLNFEEEVVPSEINHLIVLTPDDSHGQILKQIAEKNSERQLCFLFAHGYSFIKENLKEVFPQYQFALLAPKAIASELRERYLTKEKLVGVIDTSHCQDQKEFIETVAKKMGLTQLISSSFKDEAQADLFSEQTLLCSLLPYGALKSYEFLLKKGIDPELAFVECWMEVKLIADAMLDKGPVGYLNLISPNAFIGGEKAQERIFDENYDKKLDSLWKDIENGSFFREIDAMNVSKLKEQVLNKWKDHPLQSSFKKFKGDVDDESKNN
jgi:ketol-acid reductoisomerase